MPSRESWAWSRAEQGGVPAPAPSARGDVTVSPRAPPFLIRPVRVPIPASRGCWEGHLRKNPNVWGTLRGYRRRGRTLLCIKLQKKHTAVCASSRELQSTRAHWWDRTESLDSAVGGGGRDVPPRKAMLMHDPPRPPNATSLGNRGFTGVVTLKRSHYPAPESGGTRVLLKRTMRRSRGHTPRRAGRGPWSGVSPPTPGRWGPAMLAPGSPTLLPS